MNPDPTRDEPASPVRAWLPHPVLSLLLAASWLLLIGRADGPDLFWAALIALLVPRLLRGFLPPRGRVRPRPALRLLLRVLGDIVVANLVVARLVLGPVSRLRPAWVRVPLATSHHRVVALLAMIITSTPGTVSCVVDEARGEILVHALDCDDAQAMAAEIKQRYEAALMDVFGLAAGAGVRA